jgi:hypothetical protein
MRLPLVMTQKRIFDYITKRALYATAPLCTAQGTLKSTAHSTLKSAAHAPLVNGTAQASRAV